VENHLRLLWIDLLQQTETILEQFEVIVLWERVDQIPQEFLQFIVKTGDQHLFVRHDMLSQQEKEYDI
jgi:hypothetical protein